MATQVSGPRKQQDNSLSNIATIGGAVVGGIFGGPQGAVAGAGAGSMLGGMLSPEQKPDMSIQTGGDNAMSRRIQSDERLNQLMEAKSAVAQLPPEQQQQYAAPINQAYAMERQRRGMA